MLENAAELQVVYIFIGGADFLFVFAQCCCGYVANYK